MLGVSYYISKCFRLTRCVKYTTAWPVVGTIITITLASIHREEDIRSKEASAGSWTLKGNCTYNQSHSSSKSSLQTGCFSCVPMIDSADEQEVLNYDKQISRVFVAEEKTSNLWG